ncbi:MAG: membrane protein insertase YidC [Gemmatimonadetes bacterium]|nr:membrane protein insertase YidC [Gemmatimonadota bacterium]NNM06940.1 membrane protein insertase YidC [Gemmatimonadota bacterium]
MRTEFRFVVAIALMMGVLVATNILFPPIVPDDPVPEAPAAAETPPPAGDPEAAEPSLPPSLPPQVSESDLPAEEEEPSVAGAEERTIRITTPLYEMELSNRGAVVRSVRVTQYASFAREGAAELVEEPATGMLGTGLVVAGDTVDLSDFVYTVEPEGDLQLEEESEPRTLTLRYDHPEGRFFHEIRYTYYADRYLVDVDGSLPALDRAALFVDLGPGLAYNELDQSGEASMAAYAGNRADGGIENRLLRSVDEPEVLEGPLLWGAAKSKFFVAAVLPGTAAQQGDPLAGVWAEPAGEDRARIRVAAQVQSDGRYAYRTYLGPIERSRLMAAGDDLHEVNPYGWAFLRPIIRPFVGVILWVLNFLHDQLLIGYGWVLIIFAVLMRVLLWPLNQRAMRSQLRNMAVQPLLQEIQAKYKNDPERLQKEMTKLWKDHGFNPFGGCLPMLIPYPVLIALFFVFQNTIELRGQPFLWLPDLSAPDPLYLLPLLMGLSMFLLQWISFRSMDQVNPQMKMMMWIMPIMMVFIFFRFASGLNLYYAAVNVATLPQQYWIAGERKKVRAAGPPKSS